MYYVYFLRLKNSDIHWIYR